MYKYNKIVSYILTAYIITRLVNYYNNGFENISIISVIILFSLFIYVIYWSYLDYKKDKLKSP